MTSPWLPTPHPSSPAASQISNLNLKSLTWGKYIGSWESRLKGTDTHAPCHCHRRHTSSPSAHTFIWRMHDWQLHPWKPEHSSPTPPRMNLSANTHTKRS